MSQSFDRHRRRTHAMRHGDIIGPGGRSKDTALCPRRRLAEKVLRGVREDTQYDLVVLLDGLGQVCVRAGRIVLVRLRPPRAHEDSDTIRAAV
jgi:hypothetical protein